MELLITSEGDESRSGILLDLSISLTDRYFRLGEPKDLHAALQRLEEVVQLSPNEDPHLAGILQSLGVAFRNQYLTLGKVEDLEAAVGEFQNASKLLP
jgi:hypothetical protein